MKNNNEILIEYKKINNLGKGGFGNAILAREIALDREVVIKEIPEFKLPINDFFRESKILHESKHPGVVEAFYAGKKRGIYFKNEDDDDYIINKYHNKEIDFFCLAMKYYKNGDLENKIENLNLIDSVSYIIDILQSLHHIHSKGLIHKDIKANNILISDNNKALIADFGTARKFENGEAVISNTAQDGLFHATRPPESLVKGYPATRLTDIYQTGVLFYLMLRNQKTADFLDVAFQRSNYNIRNFYKNINEGNVYLINELNNQIPQKVINILKRMIHIDPSKRYQNCISIINDLCDIY